MLKHTPGPWITNLKLYRGQCQVTSGTGQLVVIACVNGQAGEQEENAKLIALAPKLLEFVTAYMGDTLSCDMITDMADLLVENTKD